MKLYLGSRDYRPEGFLCVDVDPKFQPDILADVADLRSIASGTVEEVCASHVLEHIAWPRAFLALSEWTRVLRVGGRLRVAVPDMAALAAMIAEGRNVWGAAGIVFGVGRLDNALEAHQYGYTRAMLIQMLQTLGYGDFDWWKHDLPDASNGWLLDDDGRRIALSLDIQADKKGPPLVPPKALYEALAANRLRPFDQVVMEILAESPAESINWDLPDNPLLTQRMHMALIEARMRVLHLEQQMARTAA